MWRAGTMALVCVLLGCTGDPETADGSGGAANGGGGQGGSDGGAGGGAPVDCPAGEKSGTEAGADGLLTAGGIEYNVRVPADYDATRAYPLVVVFSPRVQNDSASDLEVFTALGPDATERGYIAAFAEWFDPVPVANRLDADTIRVDVAATWCVDEARIYYTGHSDGGSISTLLPLLHGAPVAAVAPSAAGIEEANGPGLGCGDAVPAMIIHSVDDTIFPMPAHGIGAANHWASCFDCAELGTPMPDGCIPFNGCIDGAEVLWCEQTGTHYQWYGLNQSMLDFFDRHVRALP